MKFKQITVTNYLFETIAKLSTKIELDKYLVKHPNTFADNIEIDNISFLGYDEIELFFKCKTTKEFFNLIN